jgi:site-specific recombinase XerD
VPARPFAAVSGLNDAGQPIRFIPHDFRRLFATDPVNGGLPLHIAAALLGPLGLDTTCGYTAVFPENLINRPPSQSVRKSPPKL